MLKIRRLVHSGFLAGLVAAAAFLPCSLPALAADITSISLQVPAKVYTKSSYSIPVNIDQVSSLNAANFRISFDPAFIAIDSVSDGSIGGSPFPVEYRVFQTEGICNVVNFTGDMSTLSGSGSLAVIHLTTKSQTGSASLLLSNGTLSSPPAGTNTKPQAIQALWADASLTIKTKSTSSGGGGGGGGGYVPASPTPTPTPSPAVPVASPTPTPTPEVPVTTTPASPSVTPELPATTPAASPSASPAIMEPSNTAPSGTAAAVEKTTTVTVTTEVPAPQPTQPSNWWWIIILIAAIALIAVIGLTVLRKRTAK